MKRCYHVSVHKFLFYTFIKYDDEGAIEDPNESKLIDTKKHAHVGDYLIDFHFFVMKRIDHFADVIVKPNEDQ